MRRLEGAGRPNADAVGAVARTPEAIARDEAWMRQALDEADVAASMGEVPVGCILVDPDGIVIARGHNLKESLADPTAHAEMVALREASRVRARYSWRFDDLTAFVTLEPCPMCAGAFVNARVKRVVYGCDDAKAGAVRSLFTIGQDDRLNHRFSIDGGVLGEECAGRLSSFFSRLRASRKK